MKKVGIFLATLLFIISLTACKDKAEPAPAAEVDPQEELAYYEDDEYYDGEYYDEDYYEDEDGLYYEDEQPQEADAAGNTVDEADAVGKWYTDGYDADTNWAMSYCIELTADGKASCEGYRNKDTGTYTVSGNKVTITFDKCAVDEEGKGYSDVKDFVYTVEMTIKGDDATIKIDAPDVISNLEDGTVHRDNKGQTDVSENNGTVDASNIADGSYLTDEKYSGEISDDGSTVTITTGLGHYDKDWKMIKDYDKQTFVFTTAKNCKCVIMGETTETYPVKDQIGFINDFLHGNSELPIGLVIKKGELVEINFSS